MGIQFLELANLGKNGALRWVGGTLLVLFLWLIVGTIISFPFLVISGMNLFTGNLATGDPFWIYIAVSVSFPFIWLGVWLAVRFIHQRPFQSLITPASNLSWSRFGTGFVVWGAVAAIAQVAEFMIYPGRAQWTFDLYRWLSFLPVVLILTPIQTCAEELLFRGYWLQGLGRLTKNLLLLSTINGILFALPHMLNPEFTANPESGLLLFLNYFLTGAALAFVTLRDNRLELALGAHTANNLFAGLVVNYKDSALTTPSLFTTPVLDPVFGLAAFAFCGVAFYLIVFKGLDQKPQ